MQEGSPTHTLPSFTTYVNKVFHLREALPSLRDARQDPEIPPATVFEALFYAFVFRLRSFKELEADLAQPQFQHRMDAPRAFRDDTLRYSLSGFALEPLENMLVAANRQLKRNKAFEPGRVQGRIVAALDGIEILSSYSRCCDDCSQRRVNLTARANSGLLCAKDEMLAQLAKPGLSWRRKLGAKTYENITCLIPFLTR